MTLRWGTASASKRPPAIAFCHPPPFTHLTSSVESCFPNCCASRPTLHLTMILSAPAAPSSPTGVHKASPVLQSALLFAGSFGSRVSLQPGLLVFIAVRVAFVELVTMLFLAWPSLGTHNMFLFPLRSISRVLQPTVSTSFVVLAAVPPMLDSPRTLYAKE